MIRPNIRCRQYDRIRLTILRNKILLDPLVILHRYFNINATSLMFHELPLASSSIFVMNFPQINLFYQVPIALFLEFYSECIQNIDSLYHRVLHFTNCPYESASHKTIVQSFYYLLVLMVFKERIDITSFTIQLSTDLTVDGTYVFAPSFMVCLAACLLRWARLQNGAHDNFSEADLRTIQSYAVSCHQLCTEYEVIDVISCISGSIAEYLEGSVSPLRALLYARVMPVMTILLVDSKKSQDPEIQSQQMKELMFILPETSTSIFNSIDIISKRAYNVFHQICEIYQDGKLTNEWKRDCILKQYHVIKHFIMTNQNLLRALNVSHSRLDDICMIAQKHGMCGKYTNICHGRYAYVWCPRHVNEPCNHITPLINDLKTRGYDITETRFTCNGLRIDPMPV